MNTTTTTNQQSQATATPQEQQLEQNQLDFSNFTQPFQKSMFANLSSNINSILTGQQPMATGVGGITADQTQSMVNQGLKSLYPQLQANGIMDSGEATQAGLTTAAGIANNNAQFNVSAAQNLFNLASGGQSNLQGQAQNNNATLGTQLAELRTVTGSQSTMSNPFLQSFYSSLGKAIPGAIGGSMSGGGGSGAGILSALGGG